MELLLCARHGSRGWDMTVSRDMASAPRERIAQQGSEMVIRQRNEEVSEKRASLHRRLCTLGYWLHSFSPQRGSTRKQNGTYLKEAQRRPSKEQLLKVKSRSQLKSWPGKIWVQQTLEGKVQE